MTAAPIEDRFDRDTAVSPLGDGHYVAMCSADWGVPAGLNGGYVAAILARAIVAETDDPQRMLRSFSVQFVRPPTPDVELLVTVVAERVGRTVTSLSVRAVQDGRLIALGIALAATNRVGALDYTPPPPDLPAAADVPTLPALPGLPPIASRYVLKPALGPAMFSEGDEALTGGWIRLADPRPFDVLAAVACLDAWLPAPFTRLAAPAAAPTLDYTVHIRSPLPLRDLDPAAFLMVRIRSTMSGDGYFEEDSEVWSPDGVLLAHGRQLALLVPMEPAG